ncbi:hypothetical protein KEM09_09905 [Carboxylicivirga mesophila]|uniref:histidine kinase n=1 Tax=Carboxylicivirga mesophila TaxID=1166478 RepID=A0ABS5KB39_9BACT|nr:ATP-binding protein [Carboxylicivirga mesophila]MBS2211718.1 hypothetical protein [Carboxylicivirga mesophila]
MLGKQFINRIKELVLIKPDEYTIQELVLIHMLHITLCLIVISAIFNPFLGLPMSVIYSNFASSLIITFIYWVARIKRKFRIAKRLYLAFVVLMINFLWLETAGSSGPTLFYILAFVPLLTFLLNNNLLKYAYMVIGINVPGLLLIEAYFPEIITYYPSEIQRVLDILMVCLIFIIFEIPLIIYIKNLVINQRNEALHSERIKTSYVTHLSHEIRTPMNAILGFAELLEQDDLELAERKEYINIINDNGHTLLNLLNNIINIAKIEEDSTKVSLSKFNPDSLLKRIQASLSFKASNGVDFKTLKKTNESVMIHSDIILLYQILSNLTFNALKFTQQGHVYLSYAIIGDSIKFTVEDTGLGICQSKHDSLFNQFEQDSDNKLVNFNGSGLGLTISKNLSHLLKGKLYFESEKDRGTSFHLEIPVDYKVTK